MYDQWRDLLLALKIRHSKIQVIDNKYPGDVEKCMEEVIKIWLESAPDASWERLCSALRDDIVDCSCIAEIIENKIDSS